MGLSADFDDRKTHIESEAEAYHPYEYQTENNSSWAGALPVKQYVPNLLKSRDVAMKSNLTFVEDYTTQTWKRMLVVSVLPGTDIILPYISCKLSANHMCSHIKGKASHKIVSDGQF